MFNASFYPTPATVARTMLSGLDGLDLASRTVLEPSAGKGDLADVIASAMNFSGYYRGDEQYRSQVHCIEIEPELQATLRGKGYPLVGTDFLNFWPDERYDLIVMNPPFADAEKHLLHAWEILDSGDILCLLNEQMLLNPCSASRELLNTIVSEHGTVTPLGACFAQAERRTDVCISLVRLTKARQEPFFGFSSAGMEEEEQATLTNNARLESEVATRNLVGNMVANYTQCRELFARIASLTQELGHYSSRFERCGGEALLEALKPLMGTKASAKGHQQAYNTFVRDLKKAAWGEVFRRTEMHNLVSAGVRRDMDQLLKANERMAFSEDNIAAMLESLFLSRGAILRQCVVEAFDHMTRYYKDNRVHVEGWKTNESWKVNERVVLPNVIDVVWNIRVKYEKEWLLNDIDRAMAFLEGKKLDNVERTVVAALEQLFKEYGSAFSGVLFKSTYFEMRCYKKGTLHMKFRDRKLWERFNLVAAEGKNWLPDDVKNREKETRNHRANKWGLLMAS